MGFFNFFQKLPTIQDDVFGTLRFVEGNEPSKNYFEGNGLFTPTGDAVEYLIDADIEGPTGDQKEFYSRIQNSYDELIAKIKPLIEDEFRNWKEDFEIKDFKKEFTVNFIRIPRLSAEPLEWEISFVSDHDRNHIFSVNFKGFELDHVHIDG